jgi:hypothetical protein
MPSEPSHERAVSNGVTFGSNEKRDLRCQFVSGGLDVSGGGMSK